MPVAPRIFFSSIYTICYTIKTIKITDKNLKVIEFTTASRGHPLENLHEKINQASKLRHHCCFNSLIVFPGIVKDKSLKIKGLLCGAPVDFKVNSTLFHNMIRDNKDQSNNIIKLFYETHNKIYNVLLKILGPN